MQNEFTLIFPRSGSWGTRSSFALYSPSFCRQRATCWGTQSVLSCSVRTPCRPPVSPALHSPSTQTRTPRAFLRLCFQASSQACLPLHDTLLPLSHFIHEWEHLPGVSLWVLRTIRSGYTLQFERSSPRFDGVQLTAVNSASKASVLQQELSSLLQKGAIEDIPQSDIERGFFSRYFLVPKRDGGLRPILDLRHLNFSLYKGKFKMLTMKTIMSQIQGGMTGSFWLTPGS